MILKPEKQEGRLIENNFCYFHKLIFFVSFAFFVFESLIGPTNADLALYCLEA